MLTFGLASPLLALVLIFAFVTNVTTTLIGIDLYLEASPRCRQLHRPEDPEDGSSAVVGSERVVPFEEEAMTVGPIDSVSTAVATVTSQTVPESKAETAEDPTGGLEEACVLSAWAPHSLYWPVALIASSFWGLMVFDMVGNTVAADPRKALWAPLVALLVPLAMGAVFFSSRSHAALVSFFTRFFVAQQAQDRSSALAVGDDFGLEGRETELSSSVEPGALYRSGITNGPQLNPMLSPDTTTPRSSEAGPHSQSAFGIPPRVERQGSSSIKVFRSNSNSLRQSLDRNSTTLFPLLSFIADTAPPTPGTGGEQGAAIPEPKREGRLDAINEN